MKKKKYVVKCNFTAHFEEETDADALAAAAFGIKYGVHTIRNLGLQVVAALPIATTEAPKEAESIGTIGVPETPQPQSQSEPAF